MKDTLVGQRFGRWVVLKTSLINRVEGRSRTNCLCLCDCGTERWVLSQSLTGARSQSCGCLKSEKMSARVKTHGLTDSQEYASWLGMKARCTNPNHEKWHRYGGRGITVCERWLNSFETFLSDMGKAPSQSHTIDRQDLNGDYTPKNCRWATKKEQSNNTRRNHFFIYRGHKMTIAEIARAEGVKYSRLYSYLCVTKYPVEEAVTLCKS